MTSANSVVKLSGFSPAAFMPALKNCIPLVQGAALGAAISTIGVKFALRILKVQEGSNTDYIIRACTITGILSALPYTQILQKVKHLDTTPQHCPHVGITRMFAVAALCLTLHCMWGYDTNHKLKECIDNTTGKMYFDINLSETKKEKYLLEHNSLYKSLWRREWIRKIPFCSPAGIPLHQRLIPCIVTLFTSTIGGAATVLAFGSISDKIGKNHVPYAIAAGSVGALFYSNSTLAATPKT